jgi:hypothetical protein
MHGTEPAWTRSTQKAQEKRLGLIVPGMRDGNSRCTETPGGALEECVSRSVRRVLDRGTRIARELRDVRSLDLDRDPPGPGEITAELLIRIGIGAAKLVIQVRRAHDLKAPLSAISRSAQRSATESAPPDRATATRLPSGSSP